MEVEKVMEPVLVDGEIGRRFHVMRLLAGVGVMGGLWLLAANHAGAGWLLVIIAGLALLIVQIVVARTRMKRRWVSDTGTGFLVRDRRGERSHDDEDVFGVDLEIIPIYSQGVHKGIRRIFRVKVESDTKPILMNNFIRVGQRDPLQGLVSRVVEKYREQASEALRAGAVLTGKNWTLSHSMLSVQSQPVQSTTLQEIDSVGVFDSMVCVWKKGVDEPILRVPIRSSNGFLLQLLIEKMLAERGEVENDENTVAAEGMGRILFERKGKRPWAIVSVSLAALAGIFGVSLVIASLNGAEIGVAIGGGISLLFAVLILFLGLTMWRGVFRCHERGVYIRSLFDETQLRYENVREFSYSSTRQFYNGVYIGTSVMLKLVPDAAGGKPVKYGTTVKNVDDSLENLRDHIARLVSHRMLDELARGHRVQWTANLAIHPSGIEYRPGGLLGRKDAKLLSFEELHGFDIQDGTFHLWDRSNGKSIMQESVGAANFFPGYFVLLSLCVTP